MILKWRSRSIKWFEFDNNSNNNRNNIERWKKRCQYANARWSAQAFVSFFFEKFDLFFLQISKNKFEQSKKPLIPKNLGIFFVFYVHSPRHANVWMKKWFVGWFYFTTVQVQTNVKFFSDLLNLLDRFVRIEKKKTERFAFSISQWMSTWKKEVIHRCLFHRKNNRHHDLKHHEHVLYHCLKLIYTFIYSFFSI